MIKRKTAAALLLSAFVLAGCAGEAKKQTELKVRHKDLTETSEETDAPVVTATPTETDPTEPEPTDVSTKPTSGSYYGDDDIMDLTMYIAMVGDEINEGNKIQELIATKTGVRLKETYLNGQPAGEAVGAIIASGQYPDLIDAGDGNQTLYANDALVAWDPYLDMYPNLRELYSDEEWDKFRMDDGHIYWANVFDNHYLNKNTSTGHSGQAFWIQTRVLKEFDYPEIKTLDEYFQILEDYYELYPTMDDGTDIIPYTILCEDWRYFCLEAPPMYLEGYPNDGCCIVNVDDPSNPVVVDYNTCDTAKKFFEKLNEEYNKGIIDPDFDDMTYDEYIEKLSTGCVLGMCDQYWDFAYSIMAPFEYNGLSKIGCDYVPLGLTIDSGMSNQWHSFEETLNVSSGVAITNSCWDPNLAFKFLSDLLEQEIHDLRFWGIEGEDYLVDENGLYYRTDEMRQNWADPSYKADQVCTYGYCPQWLGPSRDGKNMMQPIEQTSEFYASLPGDIADCLKAYGATTYAEMMGSEETELYPWYPMWTWSNNLMNDTDAGVTWQKMAAVKHEFLPKIVKASKFDSEWDMYMKAYEACEPEVFIDAAQAEVEARLALYGG